MSAPDLQPSQDGRNLESPSAARRGRAGRLPCHAVPVTDAKALVRRGYDLVSQAYYADDKRDTEDCTPAVPRSAVRDRLAPPGTVTAAQALATAKLRQRLGDDL